MRSITYVSETASIKNGNPLPRGLAKIYGRSRKSNQKEGITSVISYREGHFLQIIEGDPGPVARLFKEIQQSPLHKNIKVLIDVIVDKRFFPDSPMKLSNSLLEEPGFESYLSSHCHQLNKLRKETLQLLELFYPAVTKLIAAAPAKPKQPASPSLYEGKELNLKKWPGFDAMKPTPLSLDLCAKLVGKWVSYEVLVSNEQEPSRVHEYNALLQGFDDAGLLSARSQSESQSSVESDCSKSNFYSKLKSYLLQRVAG